MANIYLVIEIYMSSRTHAAPHEALDVVGDCAEMSLSRLLNDAVCIYISLKKRSNT